MVTNKKANERIAAVILGEKTFRATGSGAIDETLTIGSRSKVLAFRVSLSGEPAGSEEFTVTLRNTELGSDHDCLLFARSMKKVVSLHSNESFFLDRNDDLHIEFANPDGFTWSIAVIYGDE